MLINQRVSRRTQVIQQLEDLKTWVKNEVGISYIDQAKQHIMAYRYNYSSRDERSTKRSHSKARKRKIGTSIQDIDPSSSKKVGAKLKRPSNQTSQRRAT